MVTVPKMKILSAIRCMVNTDGVSYQLPFFSVQVKSIHRDITSVNVISSSCLEVLFKVLFHPVLELE